MQYSFVKTYIPQGLDAVPCKVEASILPGLPSFRISGIKSGEIGQIENRIRAAIKNSCLNWPQGRIIISLSPAWADKRGSGYDLPIALALLLASGQIPQRTEALVCLGELGLSGDLRSVPGLYNCMSQSAKNSQEVLILPQGEKDKAAGLENLKYIAAASLNEVLDVYRRKGFTYKQGRFSREIAPPRESPEAIQLFNSFRGQADALRALQISLAGWHPLMLLGSAGCGKSMLLSLAKDLLPQLETAEIYELNKIYSAANLQNAQFLQNAERPYLAPHSSVSKAALLGGGVPIQPGLFSLAHCGVLCLDELAEYESAKIETLRVALSEKQIRLARAQAQLCYPCNFLLLAASNPCRCGNLLEKDDVCTCPVNQNFTYLQKISGAIWSRFHLLATLRREPVSFLQNRVKTGEEEFYRFKDTICQAWQKAKARSVSARTALESLNAHNKEISFTEAGGYSKTSLQQADRCARKSHFSLREYTQLLRVARTIADLRKAEKVNREDVMEAYQYRPKIEERLGSYE